jgi:arylsulfatase A
MTKVLSECERDIQAGQIVSVVRDIACGDGGESRPIDCDGHAPYHSKGFTLAAANTLGRGKRQARRKGLIVRPPNIVLINCDDLGYGDLGCYGSVHNETPALDALARDGARFTNFYMASPVCSPSRAALLTGCYPPRIGFDQFDGLPVLFPGQRFGLHDDEVTLAQVLSNAGYATKLVGKWHCGDQPAFLPTRRGFDGYYGIPYSNDMGRQRTDGGFSVPKLMKKWGVPFVDEIPPLPLLLDEEVIEAQPDQASLTTRFVDESVRFIRAQKDTPFFLYLAHIYVHLPIYVQERFERESRNGKYGAAVAAIDWATGVIVAELERLGLTDDTIVIFTSDNGSRANDEGGSNLPLRGVKGTTWEGGMRVPFIVRWPGHVPAGSTCDVIATAMDLLPTLARFAGADLPTERVIDGRDISTVLVSGDSSSPHEAIWFYRADQLEAVRSGRWKLFVARDRQPITELYDLDADPAEAHDVAAVRPDVVEQLQIHAARARQELGDSVTGVQGAARRPVGEVSEPTTLTTFDESHPYYMAEYDLADRG